MLCSIVHRTDYVYTAPVEPARHLLRLSPRRDANLRVQHYVLQVDPWPAQMIEYLDVHGNSVLQADFAGFTTHLHVGMRCTVETFLPPFPGPAVQLGSVYPPAIWQSLFPYVAIGPPDGNLDALGADLRYASAGDADQFLYLLNARLARDIRHEFRVAGGPQAPAQTLFEGRGACRDVAALFVDLCRRQNIAARFVSGYQMRPGTQGPGAMHAWAEVQLPGRAGWQGFDPMHGCLAGEGYVPVAAAADAAAATPVEGGFFGSAGCTLTVEVELYA
ncbi:MAG: transglutaminase family protein [Rhodocyclaceae bacterium]|nr:transglutaminase family protein [Rhodocyclaceae bacterium]MBX3669796.1 transglutaminase family protein [Rhodocyclaceae bacterium]